MPTSNLYSIVKKDTISSWLQAVGDPTSLYPNCNDGFSYDEAFFVGFCFRFASFTALGAGGERIVAEGFGQAEGERDLLGEEIDFV